jgi:hypothetical protein
VSPELAKIGIFGTGFASRDTSGIEGRSDTWTLITIVALSSNRHPKI